MGKYDKIWGKLVRERDGKCLVCGRIDTLAAHHYIGRGEKATRFELENGISLCVSHHTFNNDFAAHRTPKDFKAWFERVYPERAESMKKKALQTMSERKAIEEFKERYEKGL